jgi:predicted RNA-binding Zn ribbon-like protein
MICRFDHVDVLCLDFLNSEWYDGRGGLEDRLRLNSWRQSFLRRWKLAQQAVLGVPNRTEMRSLRRLRTALREIISAIAAGEQPSPESIECINAFLRKRSACRVLVKARRNYELRMFSIRQNWEWVMIQIAASTADLLVKGDLLRVKACANDGCRWAYYDRSKGRTRRWCGSRLCGNVDRVRRFRLRRRERKG